MAFPQRHRIAVLKFPNLEENVAVTFEFFCLRYEESKGNQSFEDHRTERLLGTRT